MGLKALATHAGESNTLPIWLNEQVNDFDSFCIEIYYTNDTLE